MRIIESNSCLVVLVGWGRVPAALHPTAHCPPLPQTLRLLSIQLIDNSNGWRCSHGSGRKFTPSSPIPLHSKILPPNEPWGGGGRTQNLSSIPGAGAAPFWPRAPREEMQSTESAVSVCKVAHIKITRRSLGRASSASPDCLSALCFVALSHW